MGNTRRLICASGDVIEKGKGVRFTLDEGTDAINAFLIRYRGIAYGFLNRCSHISVELDWAQGEFFDYTGIHLICATHGARYAPNSGKCLGGPCQGRGLTRLEIEEVDGSLYLINGPMAGIYGRQSRQ